MAIVAVIVVLLFVSLAVLAGRLELSSPFVRTIGDPQVYAGPAGWLVGCAPSKVVVEREVSVQETAEPEKVAEKAVKETVAVEVEKEVTQIVEKEVTDLATSTLPPATQAVAPTPTSVTDEIETPAATAPPSEGLATRLPAPPPPLLGQYVPETIYWMPEAITDASGRYSFEIPLPDTPATWRLSVVASTREGVLGSAQSLLTARP
jgi:hypothetical protein